MNSYYAPQNGYYPNHYAPAPQLQYAPMPVVQQTSGSGMKVVAGALALLAIGIAAFAVVFGMKKDSGVENTAAQSAPSTVINLPSEINIPSLGSSTPPQPGSPTTTGRPRSAEASTRSFSEPGARAVAGSEQHGCAGAG